MTPPLLLTIPEAAAELRVHTKTVYARISAGLIKTVNLAETGNRSKTRIRRSELERYIKSCEQKQVAS